MHTLASLEPRDGSAPEGVVVEVEEFLRGPSSRQSSIQVVERLEAVLVLDDHARNAAARRLSGRRLLVGGFGVWLYIRRLNGGEGRPCPSQEGLGTARIDGGEGFPFLPIELPEAAVVKRKKETKRGQLKISQS